MISLPLHRIVEETKPLFPPVTEQQQISPEFCPDPLDHTALRGRFTPLALELLLLGLMRSAPLGTVPGKARTCAAGMPKTGGTALVGTAEWTGAAVCTRDAARIDAADCSAGTAALPSLLSSPVPSGELPSALPSTAGALSSEGELESFRGRPLGRLGTAGTPSR